MLLPYRDMHGVTVLPDGLSWNPRTPTLGCTESPNSWTIATFPDHADRLLKSTAVPGLRYYQMVEMKQRLIQCPPAHINSLAGTQ